ncbi:hypothetical protein FH972_023352 [Carpinus fangiana]|uniref:DUF1917 domain-containing protein n=1 Tax=Carpinus fangiana TaxID=176857 RepID=A0A5N6KVK4_9ROSI|nr:hypothetical protein FH972_023352 [Carpinus fangiana]
MAPAVVDFIDGDGAISDDSDFYGNEPDNRPELEAYIGYADRLPYNIAYRAGTKLALAPGERLHNPLEGDKSAWQLNETIDIFLKRLPPSTALNIGPWIWMPNPRSPPKAQEPDNDAFIDAGDRLLANFLAENGGKAPTGRGVKAKVQKLESELKQTAKRYNVASGKWMLFPSEGQVDRVWKTVCDAMLRSNLGNMAKVATKDETKDGRLVCIYTYDFENEADVKRVCTQLKLLGLIPDKGIYYKADAWTLLDLGSKNDYGIKASIYGSRDMLKG